MQYHVAGMILKCDLLRLEVREEVSQRNIVALEKLETNPGVIYQHLSNKRLFIIATRRKSFPNPVSAAPLYLVAVHPIPLGHPMPGLLKASSNGIF